MQPKHPFFLVLCDDGERGPYIPETHIARLNDVSVCKDLRDGQYSHPIMVIEVNPIAHSCADVTHIFRPLFEPDKSED
jgi:hypothetical protein